MIGDVSRYAISRVRIYTKLLALARCWGEGALDGWLYGGVVAGVAVAIAKGDVSAGEDMDDDMDMDEVMMRRGGRGRRRLRTEEA